MAYTKIVSGVLREIFQEAVPQGAAAQTVLTGIRVSPGQLSRIRGFLTIDSATGAPVVTATASVVNGLLQVVVSNAAAGTTFTSTLDVMLTQSSQQGRDAAAGAVIMIVNSAVASPGEPLIYASRADSSLVMIGSHPGAGPIGAGSISCFLWGEGSTIAANAVHVLVLGASSAVGDSSPDVVCAGHDNQIGATSGDSIVVGHGNVIGALGGEPRAAAMVLGNYCSVPDSFSNVILLGQAVTATAINQCLIGSVGYGITTFQVTGTSDLATFILRAVANPLAGETGLSLVHNNGANIVNRTIKAAVAPPEGSLLLYIDP